jgi:hypothetical protein
MRVYDVTIKISQTMLQRFISYRHYNKYFVRPTSYFPLVLKILKELFLKFLKHHKIKDPAASEICCVPTRYMHDHHVGIIDSKTVHKIRKRPVA